MPLPKIWKFEAFGTNWSIESEKKIDPTLRRHIAELLERYELEFSRFRTDSKVFKMSEKPGLFSFDEALDAQKLFRFYEQLFDVTDGAVSPLIGDTLRDAGYDEHYRLRPNDTFRRPPKYYDIVSRNANEISLKTPIMFDVGAAGKGHAVDLVCDMLRAKAIEDFVIDASGDIRVNGDVEQTIGLENPFATNEIIGTARIKNRSICASATNRRAWADLHHIFDARTAQPTKTYVATWAICDSAMFADGCATALFFVDKAEILEEMFGISYVRIDSTGTIETSRNIIEKGVTLFS